MESPLEGTASVAPLTLGCPSKPHLAWRLSRGPGLQRLTHLFLPGLPQCAGSARTVWTWTPRWEPQKTATVRAGATVQHPLSRAGPGLPGEAWKGSLSPSGMRHNEAAHLPQDLRGLPHHVFLFPQAWVCGQLDSPSQPPQSLRGNSPEGHDHHQGNDGSLQEALADAGLVWDHR